MPGDIALVVDQFVADRLLGICRIWRMPRQQVDDICGKMKAVQPVAYHHVKRRRGRAFFHEAAHMQIVVVGPLIGQPMDKRGIPMIGKHNRRAGRKERVERAL